MRWGPALDDETYIEHVVRSARAREVGGIRFPALPAQELQLQFVGCSGEVALREAAVFYRAVKSSLARAGRPLRADSTVLDFGVGWGRFARFFAHDVDPGGLHGVDIDPEIVAEARRCEVPGSLEVIAPWPPSRLGAAAFDLVYAYSVFSHLSAPLADAWVREFARVLKPGGILIFTSRGRSFIDFVVRARAGGHDWTPRAFSDPAAAYRAFDAGQVVFDGTSRELVRDASFYGHALIPVAHVLSWPLRLLEYVEELCPGAHQTYFVLQSASASDA